MSRFIRKKRIHDTELKLELEEKSFTSEVKSERHTYSSQHQRSRSFQAGTSPWPSLQPHHWGPSFLCHSTTWTPWCRWSSLASRQGPSAGSPRRSRTGGCHPQLCWPPQLQRKLVCWGSALWLADNTWSQETKCIQPGSNMSKQRWIFQYTTHLITSALLGSLLSGKGAPVLILATSKIGIEMTIVRLLMDLIINSDWSRMERQARRENGMVLPCALLLPRGQECSFIVIAAVRNPVLWLVKPYCSSPKTIVVVYDISNLISRYFLETIQIISNTSQVNYISSLSCVEWSSWAWVK